MREYYGEHCLEKSSVYSGMTEVVEKLSGTSLLVLDSAPHLHNILQGIPSEYFVKHAYYRNRRSRPQQDIDPARDRCGLIWFAPILPYTTKEILPYLDACRKTFETYDFDFYMAMLLLNPRAVICLMAIIYDKDDANETAQAEQLYSELLTDMRARQYQQYRAGLPAWERIFEAAPEILDLNNKIKTALDPNNVLAPGRYGIDGEP
jgi:4-cresol dehydrogenase (hydroxylating)